MLLLRSVSNMKYLFVADCVIVTSQYNALLNGTLFWNGIQEPYTTLFYRFFILAKVPFYRIPSPNEDLWSGSQHVQGLVLHPCTTKSHIVHLAEPLHL